ncbi:MAG: type IX secretion system membrane protein PorP/SprF [Bacteroidetes bacterium]|nr:type IX secretion system membrane protein PorP/SprF [Bacteroidota bacterium]
MNKNIRYLFFEFCILNFVFFFPPLGGERGACQQPPQWSQYLFNNYMINPAVGGLKDYMDIKLGYRYQWLGIFDAPPQTMFISIHKPFNLYQEPNEYTKKFNGLGASISKDATGPISNIDLKISYSRHKRLGRKDWASAGIALGVMQFRLNAGGLIAAPPGDPDLLDPDVRSISAFAPDIQGGVWFTGERYFAGASVYQIFPMPLGGTRSKLSHHYYFMGGYKHSYNPWWAIIPMAEIKNGVMTPFTFDVNANVEYINKYPGALEKVWGGIGYRKGDAIVLNIGTVIGYIEVGYAFDYTLSGLRRYSSNTHEIIIGFRYTKIEREPRCPAWG